MTVTIGKPHYLSAEQIRMLAAHGHVIGAHSWDHPDLRTATAKDWPVQMGKPKQQLEEITGKPVLYFAWPYGMWNDESVAALKHYGYKAAFQLTGKPGLAPTSFTIRRLMVSGSWSAATLYNQLLQVFN